MAVLIQDFYKGTGTHSSQCISVEVKKILRKSQAHFTGRGTKIENEAK